VDDVVLKSLPVISRNGHGLKAAAAFSSWFFTIINCECRKLERAMFRREPPGAIKSRLHSARELVREYMISPKALFGLISELRETSRAVSPLTLSSVASSGAVRLA
jgi:DNA-directed RNA polymerase specialized sigma24 family protein